MKYHSPAPGIRHDLGWPQTFAEMAGSHHAEEEIVDFILGEQGYSVAARFVREIRSLGSYTSVPLVPPYILGQIDVRGQRLPVLDLRPLLDISHRPPCEDAAVLIVSDNGFKVGLLADSVMALGRSDDRALKDDIVAAQNISWIRGVDPQRHLRLDLSMLLVAIYPAINDLSA